MTTTTTNTETLPVTVATTIPRCGHRSVDTIVRDALTTNHPEHQKISFFLPSNGHIASFTPRYIQFVLEITSEAEAIKPFRARVKECGGEIENLRGKTYETSRDITFPLTVGAIALAQEIIDAVGYTKMIDGKESAKYARGGFRHSYASVVFDDPATGKTSEWKSIPLHTGRVRLQAANLKEFLYAHVVAGVVTLLNNGVEIGTPTPVEVTRTHVANLVKKQKAAAEYLERCQKALDTAVVAKMKADADLEAFADFLPAALLPHLSTLTAEETPVPAYTQH